MDLSKIRKRLEKNGFTVSCFARANEAAEYLEQSLRGETIGFGGSVTLRDMGLYERLGKNNTVIWHWKTPEARNRYPEFTAYLTSVNAASETGELVNIDGAGNRVAASIFGPKKVFFILGSNKVRPDLASAIDRARNVASPLNAKRLERKTPCVASGKCHDCSSPERICGVMSIHMRPLIGAERSEVVLIEEPLGY
ncbi:MAG: lactate utilization protein [Planctomycetota bacterium]|nr:lactate utilization protein [Planctomycetota bacterium]